MPFRPDGRSLLAVADDTVRAWRIDVDDAVLLDWIAANRYVPELTEQQRVQYNIDLQ